MKEEPSLDVKKGKLKKVDSHFKPVSINYLKQLKVPKNIAGNVSGYIRTETINEVAIRVARRRMMQRFLIEGLGVNRGNFKIHDNSCDMPAGLVKYLMEKYRNKTCQSSVADKGMEKLHKALVESGLEDIIDTTPSFQIWKRGGGDFYSAGAHSEPDRNEDLYQHMITFLPMVPSRKSQIVCPGSIDLYTVDSIARKVKTVYDAALMGNALLLEKWVIHNAVSGVIRLYKRRPLVMEAMWSTQGHAVATVLLKFFRSYIEKRNCGPSGLSLLYAALTQLREENGICFISNQLEKNGYPHFRKDTWEQFKKIKCVPKDTVETEIKENDDQWGIYVGQPVLTLIEREEFEYVCTKNGCHYVRRKTDKAIEDIQQNIFNCHNDINHKSAQLINGSCLLLHPFCNESECDEDKNSLNVEEEEEYFRNNQCYGLNEISLSETEDRNSSKNTERTKLEIKVEFSGESSDRKEKVLKLT